MTKIRNQKELKPLMNDDLLKFASVTVIGEYGEKFGEMKTTEALDLALENNLDLVLIANSEKPIVKLMNYSKFIYSQKKHQKESKKNSSKTSVKEIRLSPSIGKHDLETKVNQTRKLIEKDNKIKVVMKFKGRMITHIEVGQDVMTKFYDKLGDIAEKESEPKMDGRNLIMNLRKRV